MTWTAVAKKEFVENVRNAWVIAIAVVFLLLTFVSNGVMGLLSSVGGDPEVASVRDTVSAMRAVTGFLLPIMALMLGFGTLAGERESGSLALLAAQPLTRAEILLGKYLGLLGVLGAALAVGLGGGGLLVLVGSGGGLDDLGLLATFLGATLLWAAAWTSITLLVSAQFARRGTAIAGGLLVWFLFSILWIPLTILLVASVPTSGPGEPAPGWLVIVELLNPNSAYGGLLSRTIGGFPGIVGTIVEALLPTSGGAGIFMLALLAWTALPLAGAYALFHARDI